MKSTKLLPVVVLVTSALLASCSGAPNLSLIGGSAGTYAPNSKSGAAVAPPAASPANTNSQPPTDVAGLQSAFESVYEQVNPSVVTIEIGSRLTSSNGPAPILPFGQGNQGNGQNNRNQIVPTAEGSGFVWDTAGHIVTNNHVIDGAARITVTFADGSSYAAKLVGADPNSDLAVIQVTDAPSSLLKPIKVGDSTQVKVGQMVVAIGNPFGLANTMTTGIVSAIARSISAGTGRTQNGSTPGPTFSIPDVIQTDAAINPGNSGGVLVDMNGALVGVPSQMESQSGSNSGIGFAIPSAIVNKVAPQLISKGVAVHSYLGISGTTVTPDLVSSLNLKSGQQGVLVATVVSGGPADKAGLRPATEDASGNPTAAGDIITGIDGRTINRFEDLVSYLYGYTEPGQTVSLTVLRDGKNAQVSVTLGTQPTN